MRASREIVGDHLAHDGQHRDQPFLPALAEYAHRLAFGRIAPLQAERLQLHTLSYNLANVLRTLALPAEVAQWSLTTLREKLVKIGAKVLSHGRYVTVQLAEVAIPRHLFADILRFVARLRASRAPA